MKNLFFKRNLYFNLWLKIKILINFYFKCCTYNNHGGMDCILKVPFIIFFHSFGSR